MLIFDSYSNHVEKEGMRPAFSDSEVTPQDVPPGTAGFPVVAEKGQGSTKGAVCVGRKRWGWVWQDEGLCFDLSCLAH